MTDWTKLSPDELRERHKQYLNLQKQELRAGNRESGKKIAHERIAMWEAADEKGVDLTEETA